MMTTNIAFLLFFSAVALTAGPRTGEAARILAIMPTLARSHHIWFSSLTTELAARGHHVYSIDMQKPKIQPPTMNVTLFGPHSDEQKELLASVIKIFNSGTILEKIDIFARMSVSGCENVLKKPAMQEIISPDFKQEFDIILLNYVCHECFLGLIHRFNYIPMILATPFPQPANLYRLMGNPVYHAIPHFYHHYSMPMTNWQRLKSLAIYFVDELVYYTYQEPRMEEILRRVFGEGVPSVQELSKYIPLSLVNLLESSSRPPLTSNIIPVGGMHIPTVQPLEKKLKDFLDGAKDGAVIMSFGSLVRGDTMGDQKLDAVLKVFSRLPQRLIWKLESENLTNIPPNVMILQWLPQNDVLAHPNTRLFVSHCGGLSSMESAYHGVPVLGVPFIVDQYANADEVVSSGAGLRLPAEELTEETFYGNVTEILNNPKYYNTAQKTRAVMQDQLVKPLDRAIYYVEYVLRHKGAPHLRSPLIDLPFRTHSLVIDIVGVTAVAVIILIILSAVLLKVMRSLCRCARRSSKTQTQVGLSKKKMK